MQKARGNQETRNKKLETRLAKPLTPCKLGAEGASPSCLLLLVSSLLAPTACKQTVSGTISLP